MSWVWVIHGRRKGREQPCDRDIGGCRVSFDHPRLELLISSIRSSPVPLIDVKRLGGTTSGGSTLSTLFYWAWQCYSATTFLTHGPGIV